MICFVLPKIPNQLNSFMYLSHYIFSLITFKKDKIETKIAEVDLSLVSEGTIFFCAVKYLKEAIFIR